MLKVFKTDSVGSYDFIAYHQEFGSDLLVVVSQNGKLIERDYMSLGNIDSQWQPLIDRHVSNGF